MSEDIVKWLREVQSDEVESTVQKLLYARELVPLTSEAREYITDSILLLQRLALAALKQEVSDETED